MDNWREKIKELEAKGWSLTELGRAIDLSPQAVSDIKHGRTKAPGGMAAVRLHNIHSTGDLPTKQESVTAPDAFGTAAPLKRAG